MYGLGKRKSFVVVASYPFGYVLRSLLMNVLKIFVQLLSFEWVLSFDV